MSDKKCKRINSWRRRYKNYAVRVWCSAPLEIICSAATAMGRCEVPHRACACAQPDGRASWDLESAIRADLTLRDSAFACPLCFNGPNGCTYQTTDKKQRTVRVAQAARRRVLNTVEQFCEWRYAPLAIGLGLIFFWAAVIGGAVWLVIR